MRTVVLVRHGETDWNVEGRYTGQADVPLNARGREQACRLAADLARESFDAVYTSDLSRARETADILASRLGLDVLVEPDLREIDVGCYEGLTREQRQGRAWDGEARDEHAARVLGALERIAERHHGRILVVVHGVCMRRVQESLGLEPNGLFENCAPWTLRYEGGIFRALD